MPPRERLIRRCFVIFIIFIILGTTGTLLYPIAKMSAAAKLKYPPADCDRLA